MKLIQKVIYAVFLLVWVWLILFALGVIDGDDLGIEPLVTNNTVVQNPSDRNQGNDADAQADADADDTGSDQEDSDDTDDADPDADADDGMDADTDDGMGTDADTDDADGESDGDTAPELDEAVENENLLPEVTTSINVLDEWDSANPLFSVYDYSAFENGTYDFTMSVEQNIQGMEWGQNQSTEQVIDWIFDVDAQVEEDILIWRYQFSDFAIDISWNELVEQQLGDALETFREGFLWSWYAFEVDSTGNIVDISIETDSDDLQNLDFVEQFTEMVRDGFFLLPGWEVGEGWSWELVRSIDAPWANVVNTMVFTVESVDDGQATLDIEITQVVDWEGIGSWEWSAIIEDSSPFPVELNMSTVSNFSVPVQQQWSVSMEQTITTTIFKL